MSAENCSATGSLPCVICGKCHYNACPELFGGDPERPACKHNGSAS